METAAEFFPVVLDSSFSPVTKSNKKFVYPAKHNPVFLMSAKKTPQ